MPEISRPAKKPYRYQERDISRILELIRAHGRGYNVLYQLPTGGGKTVVFCEIAKRFLEEFGQDVTILTHRKELCTQTSKTLTAAGVTNRVINAGTRLPQKQDCVCSVAMVETLKNRIKTKQVSVSNVGLVIIDEAHNNSFQKLLRNFPNAFIVGVTATPFSSDKSQPLRKNYQELIVGESIESLIAQKFLATPKTIKFPMDLQTLTTGISGDYTISSSDALYSMPAMLQLLLDAYRQNADKKKTLIFNAGIATSLNVQKYFSENGYDIRHLDNRTPDKERAQILKWFKKTKGAILTSVSILTTGFDEPTVQAVILNRATTSLTLYHQMVGRGARWLDAKRTFTIIDLGNNAERFGEWSEAVDWQFAFDHPDEFGQGLQLSASHAQGKKSALSAEARAMFAKSAEVGFDIDAAFDSGTSHRKIIQESIRQHAVLCLENAESLSHAAKLTETLQPDIEMRVKEYAKRLGKATPSYREWLVEDYRRRLDGLVTRTLKRKIAA